MSNDLIPRITVRCNIQGGSKKGNPLLAAILKYFLEVINLSVYIFGKCILFYVSGEEIVEKMQELI